MHSVLKGLINFSVEKNKTNMLSGFGSSTCISPAQPKGFVLYFYKIRRDYGVKLQYGEQIGNMRETKRN